MQLANFERYAMAALSKVSFEFKKAVAVKTSRTMMSCHGNRILSWPSRFLKAMMALPICQQLEINTSS